jgi:hypothetical protein
MAKVVEALVKRGREGGTEEGDQREVIDTIDSQFDMLRL